MSWVEALIVPFLDLGLVLGLLGFVLLAPAISGWWHRRHRERIIDEAWEARQRAIARAVRRHPSHRP